MTRPGILTVSAGTGTGHPRAAEALPEAAAEARPELPVRRRGGRRARMLREVVHEVEGLRPLVELAVQQYELRITAQLAEVLRALYGQSNAVPAIPSVRVSDAMLRAIRAVEVKPHRGRAKDLVRLHELVAELTELLTPAE
jgi:hypothetical protein